MWLQMAQIRPGDQALVLTQREAWLKVKWWVTPPEDQGC